MSSVAKTPLLTREKYSELGKTINVFDAYDLVHIQEWLLEQNYFDVEWDFSHYQQ